MVSLTDIVYIIYVLLWKRCQLRVYIKLFRREICRRKVYITQYTFDENIAKG